MVISGFENSKKTSIIFWTSLVVFWLFFPVLGMFLGLLLFGLLRKEDVPSLLLFTLIALTFGLIAYSAKSASAGDPTDIVRYTNQFSWMSSASSFSEIVVALFLSDGSFYIVFHSLTLLLAKTFPNNPQVLPLFWVSVSYLFLLFGIVELTKYKEAASKGAIFFLIFLALFGTTLFPQQVELLKQATATPVFFYGIFRFINGKNKGILISFIALFIHFSVIIFFPLFFVKRTTLLIRYFFPLLALAFLFAAIDPVKLIGYLSGGLLLEKSEFYSGLDEWKINKINYLLFAIYTIVTLFLNSIGVSRISVKHNKSILGQHLLSANNWLFLILTVQLSNGHNFARYTYLYSPAYILAVWLLIMTKIPKSWKSNALIGVLFVYLLLNASYFLVYSNSSYKNDFLDGSVRQALFYRVDQILNCRVVN